MIGVVLLWLSIVKSIIILLSNSYSLNIYTYLIIIKGIYNELIEF